MSQFKGILFDFDGTLADTMDDNFEAWQSVMRGYHVDLRPEDYFPFEGLTVKGIASQICEQYNLNKSDLDHISRAKDSYYMTHHRFAFYPGVEELVARLKQQDISLGVVTGGQRDRIEKTVPASFLDMIDVLITGDMTERGKPYPDPYIRAMQELKLGPNECLAVENAPLGIKAAKRAGLYCIAICSTLDISHLGEADEIVKDFLSLSRNTTIGGILNGSGGKRESGLC